VWLVSFVQVKVSAFDNPTPPSEVDASFLKVFVMELGSKFDKLESRLDKLESKVDSKFDKLESRLDKLETKVDTKLDKLAADVQQVKLDLEVNATTSLVLTCLSYWFCIFAPFGPQTSENISHILLPISPYFHRFCHCARMGCFCHICIQRPASCDGVKQQRSCSNIVRVGTRCHCRRYSCGELQ